MRLDAKTTLTRLLSNCRLWQYFIWNLFSKGPLLMTATLISGKSVSEQILNQVAERVRLRTANGRRAPALLSFWSAVTRLLPFIYA